MSHLFHIVDVFAESPCTGNQLAVVLDADDLSEGEMGRISQEMNFSETTFVGSVPDPDGAYRVRIFTPSQEISFAGHPILGTASVIRDHIAPDKPSSVLLNLAVGQVPVTFEGFGDGRDVAWFLSPPVKLGPTCAPDRIAAAIQLSPSDIETKAPIQQLSAGVSAILVPLRNLAALQRSRLDLEAFAPLAREGFPSLVYLFCAETHHPENNLSARFFFVAHGVRGKIQRQETQLRFLALTCLNIDTFPNRAFLCGSSKVMKSIALPWLCCALAEWGVHRRSE